VMMITVIIIIIIIIIIIEATVVVVKRLGVRLTWAAMLVVLGVGLSAMLGSES
jgi:hypothetical protein